MYDYLIVGTGLYGAVFAAEAAKKGKSCLAIERRNHIGGNIYTEESHGINIHKYGPHIFHTDSDEAWDYVNRLADFNRYTNTPVARYGEELYNLPFNMNTFHALWGVKTPGEAKEILEAQTREARDRIGDDPKNLEEQALILAGKDIYEKLIKGYTEKQWGHRASELPSFIIKRLPFRFSYDNNYFNDRYQGIPIGGYTPIIEKLFEGVEVRLNTDFFESKEELLKEAEKVVFTGQIDAYFDFCYGPLEYRSLRFETEVLDTDNFQGSAIVNYTEYEVPYTRIIEHKHFEEFGSYEKKSEPGKTVITREYPATWKKGDEPYYPVNNDENNALYEKYKKLAGESGIFFGGRLGKYKYYDMDDVILDALEDTRAIL